MPAGVSNGYGAGYAAAGYAQMPNAQEYGIGAQGRVTVRTGTSTRVAGMVLLSGAVIAAMKLAGFRFNVGVSS